MKIFCPKCRRLFLLARGRQKLMNCIMFGIKWLRKNIRGGKILLWKIIYSMIPKMIFCTRKRLKKIKDRTAEKWTRFVIYMRKPEAYLRSCTAPEFFIAEARMCFR